MSVTAGGGAILNTTCAGVAVVVTASTTFTVTIPAGGNLPNAFVINPNSIRNTGAGVTNYMAMMQLMSVTPAPANQPAGQLPVTTPNPGFPQQGLQGGPFTGIYVPPPPSAPEPEPEPE